MLVVSPWPFSSGLLLFYDIRNLMLFLIVIYSGYGEGIVDNVECLSVCDVFTNFYCKD